MSSASILETKHQHRDTRKKKKKKHRIRLTYHQILSSILLILTSYSCGYFLFHNDTFIPNNGLYCQDGSRIRRASTSSDGTTSSHGYTRNVMGDSANVHERIDQLVKERIAAVLSIQHDESTTQGGEGTTSLFHSRFLTTLNSFVNGMVQVSKSEFLELYDYGTPNPTGGSEDEEALIIYNTKEAIPNIANIDGDTSKSYQEIKEKKVLSTLSVEDATSNCDTMNVIYSSPDRTFGHCMGIVGNYESYHIQRWIRKEILERRGENVGYHSAPFVPVGRMTNNHGINDFHLPTDSNLEEHANVMRLVLLSHARVLSMLEPIARKAATGGKVLVVMTVNRDQADLLANFVCSAVAKSLDLSKVVVFATDVESYEVSRSLGLAAFYDSEVASLFPSRQSKEYGDEAFADMMHAKVLSVLYISMLGYDVLFQDVDVVWLRNPLDYFADNHSLLSSHDVIFQDDGNRGRRFSPSSSNTGFYYMKQNARTRYLLSFMLYSGPLIMANRSHQAVMISIMNEFSSLFGLRIKILKQEDQFPCGYQFHRNRELMKDIIGGRINPYIFHMNWTKDKYNKKLFMKQMGYWHLACDVAEMRHSSSLVISTCCSVKPSVSCHFRDKPSVIPCLDSPSIDKGGKSFW